MELLEFVLKNAWAVLLVVVFFGGSIFVHELGHFLAARRRGIFVERFSIGFGPRIFSWRGKSGTEYCLSWLPLGGYVALPQLADMSEIEGEASVDVEKLPRPSYATKMWVFVMGAVFNVIFAFLLACVIWWVGKPMSVTTQVGEILPVLKVDGVEVPSPASVSELKVGDRILAVDGRSVSDWIGLVQTLAAGTGRDEAGRPRAVLTVERIQNTGDRRQEDSSAAAPRVEGGKEMKKEVLDVVVLPVLVGEEKVRMIGIVPGDDLTVWEVMEGTPAEEAGLRKGDVIEGVDGKVMFSRRGLVELLQEKKGEAVMLMVKREGKLVEVPLRAREVEVEGKKFWRIGIMYGSVEHPSPFKQVLEPVVMTWRTLTALLSPKSDIGPSQLSGPIGIASGLFMMARVDIMWVIWFSILLNMALAIFNLLPIPVLDGGHMMFATIEKILGRPLPQRLVMSLQGTFMVLLLMLVVYVSFFDVKRIVGGFRETEVEAPAKVENGGGDK